VVRKSRSSIDLPAEIERLRRRITELEIQLDDERGKRSAQTREEALRAEERLEMAIESAGLAWWDQDFSTGTVVRSASWSEMLGYDPDEIGELLEDWKGIIHPDDLPLVEEEARRHELSEIETFEVEHRLRTKDGRWKWILNWGRVVARNEEGKPLRAMGTHLDITCRKQAELDREQLIERLEGALAEIKTLRGIIPICAGCKRIRDDQGLWSQIEAYLLEHSEAEFTHGICPECESRLYPDFSEYELDNDT
jgi:PAS domain S-box-containing protein